MLCRRDLVSKIYIPAVQSSLTGCLGATSNATTADESMQLDREPDAQPAHTPPIYSVDFSAQGAASLADYLRYADDIMQPVEAHAIQSFVKGMHINHQREVVKGQLKVKHFFIEFFLPPEHRNWGYQHALRTRKGCPPLSCSQTLSQEHFVAHEKGMLTRWTGISMDLA